jgi:hypothetical protein
VNVRWLWSIALLTAALVAVTVSGNHQLAPPPQSFEGAAHWVATREPIIAVFALVRVAALLSGAYLLLVVVVSGLVRAVDEQRGAALLDRLTFGPARGFVGVMGLGALSLSMAPAANAQTSSSDTAIIRDVDAPTASPSVDAVIRPVLDQPSSPTIAPAPPSSEQYVVAAGDSLWGVAAARLSEATGRADLSDSDIAVYWRSVLAANPLPNPDLLFVDQVIELPAIAS